VTINFDPSRTASLVATHDGAKPQARASPGRRRLVFDLTAGAKSVPTDTGSLPTNLIDRPDSES